MTIAIVGAGPIAAAYAKVLRALERDVDVIGRGEESARRFAAETGIRPVTGGLDAYLSSHRIDGVSAIVALPIPQLAYAVQRLAEAGAARILVEKPAALTAQGVRSLLDAVKGKPAKIFVAFNRRFFQSTLAARALIEQDGGATSFHFEFTERADRIAASKLDSAVLQNLFLANSSHVVDLAFFLGGWPREMTGFVAGGLPWHTAGSIFAGSGCTTDGALFSWHADWTSGGRWGVDIRTSRRRLLLQPLEELQVQMRGEMAIERVGLDDRIDRDFKPGFYRQLEAFLSDAPEITSLQSLSAHADAVDTAFMPILNSHPREHARAS